MYSQIKETLKEFGQEHLLQYYDELNAIEKEELIRQIKDIDFSILDLCKEDQKAPIKGKIEPIEALKIPEIQKRQKEFESLGCTSVSKGEVAAVLLAGGQGTRLGLDKPKGMLDVGITKELYLFETLINNLMKVKEKVGSWIHLFVMTSEINDKDTRDFFAEKKYFGYNKEYVTFFKQEMAPSVDYNGKIYMEDTWKISLSPNGNGGWFSSMEKSGLLPFMKKEGIKWLNVFAVDNVLQKMVDPLFVGAVVESGYPCGGKVIRKADPFEKVGVMCKENGRPSIVEYYELTEEMALLTDENGDRVYDYGVILNYLFRVQELTDILNSNMPLHIVEKKIPYMDENKKLIKPEQPNGYKFETLVLDMIHMMDNCLVYEVEREKEFAPIKNKEGVDSLVSARALLEKNGVKL